MTTTTNMIRVKKWMAEQKMDEARKYHLRLDARFVEGEDYIEMYLDEPILKETEKAIQVAIKTETIGERYHKAMTFWIPKSQIVM